MKVGVPKELFPFECRVAATPETARRMIEKLGFEVIVESDAGNRGKFSRRQLSRGGMPDRR